MGTPLPQNEPGTLCVACWGPGKPFGDGPSPRYVNATLTNLDWGTAFETGNDSQVLIPHILEQTIAPCIYRINDGTFTWVLQWFGGFTEFSILRNSDGKSVFFHNLDQGCGLILDNEITTAAGNVAFDGFVEFTWSTAGL